MKATNYTAVHQLVTLFVFTFFGNLVLSQGPDYQWHTTAGSAQEDRGVEIASDHQGYSYITGVYRDSADFDPGAGNHWLHSAGETDIFVQKLDSTGALEWAISIGGPGEESAVSISVDLSGDVCIMGTFEDSVDFDPGPLDDIRHAFNNLDMYIVKLHGADGSLDWARLTGGNDNDFATDLTTDQYGNIYATGYFAATVDMDPGPGVMDITTVGSFDAFIQKFDETGNLIWARTFGGPSWNLPETIVVDDNLNVYTAGRFFETAPDSMDVDPGTGVFNLVSTGDFDFYTQKLDSNGSFVWGHSFGGTDVDFLYDMAVDDFGNVYTTGYFKGTANFNHNGTPANLSSAGGNDVFIRKVDTDGNFIWAKRIGGSGNETGKGIAVDEDQNVYLTGFFISTTDFDPGPGVYNITPVHDCDLFIEKLDNNGDFVWVAHIGGQGHDVSNGIAINDRNEIFTTGLFAGNNVDFDIGPGINTSSSVDGNTNGGDVFVLKLFDCQVDKSVVSNGNTFTAVEAPPATYQWVDCNDNFSPIAGETNQSFTPSQNGSYAVEITLDGCSVLSECFSTNLGIEENSLSGNISVYPNPSDDGVLNIKSFDANIGGIEVFTLQGKLIYAEKDIQSLEHQIQLDEPAGLYWLQLNNVQGTLQFKLILN